MILDEERGGPARQPVEGIHHPAPIIGRAPGRGAAFVVTQERLDRVGDRLRVGNPVGPPASSRSTVADSPPRFCPARYQAAVAISARAIQSSKALAQPNPPEARTGHGSWIARFDCGGWFQPHAHSPQTEKADDQNGEPGRIVPAMNRRDAGGRRYFTKNKGAPDVADKGEGRASQHEQEAARPPHPVKLAEEKSDHEGRLRANERRCRHRRSRPGRYLTQ